MGKFAIFGTFVVLAGAMLLVLLGGRTVSTLTLTADRPTKQPGQLKAAAEADAYTPPDNPSETVIAPKVKYAAALYDNIQRLKLNVQIIAPFHGARTVDFAEVKREAGR